LGTKKPGNTWRPAPEGFPSIALVIFVEPKGAVEAVASKIIGRRALIPPIPSLHQFYGDHAEKMKGWWELADPKRFRLPSLDALPGRSSQGLLAAQSFQIQLSFSYWNFDLFQAFAGSITPPATWPPSSGLPELFALDSLGDVRFTGHRISAFHVFSLFRESRTPEDVRVEFPTLSADLIEAAQTYYQSNLAVIDPYLDRYREDLDFLESSSRSREILAAIRARIAARRVAETASPSAEHRQEAG